MVKQSSDNMPASESITISKNMLFGSIVAVLLVLLIASVVTGGFGLLTKTTTIGTTGTTGTTGNTGSTGNTGNTGTTGNTGSTGNTGDLPTLQTLQIDGGSLPALGQQGAPVSLIEFSDFQCPFCARFYSNTEVSLVKNYVNSGKIKLYYRDYPLPFHPNADNAALAARCANDQSKFWEYHDKLFQNQNSWASLDDTAITAKLVSYAGELSLNTQTFESCLTSKKYESAMGEDIADAHTAYGGQLGTPTFFITISKSKISLEKLNQVTQTLEAQYPQSLGLGQSGDNYVVLVVGALPTNSFTSIFDAVNY